MAVYHYKARSGDGRQLSGTVNAASQREATEILTTENGLYVIKVNEAISYSFPFLNKQPSDSSFYDFIDNLISFLNSGVPIIQSLHIYLSISKDKKIKTFLHKSIEGISRGESFSAVCGNSREQLDDLFIVNVSTGEKTGNLVESLEEYQQYLKTKIQIRRKILSLTAYPIFLLISLFLILCLMFYFVLPSFVSLFSEQGTKLPLITRMLLSIGHNFHWLILSMILVFISIFYLKDHATQGVRTVIHKIIRGVPIYGTVKTLLFQLRFIRVLYSLTKVGISVTESLNVILETNRDSEFHQRLSACIHTIQSGSPFTQAISNSGILDFKYTTMIAAAEETGRLHQSLKSISEKMLETVELKMEIAMKLLEPILVLVIGLVVGFTVLAMYLPIFSISDLVY